MLRSVLTHELHVLDMSIIYIPVPLRRRRRRRRRRRLRRLRRPHRGTLHSMLKTDRSFHK
jgi:hypothetical protein